MGLLTSRSAVLAGLLLVVALLLAPYVRAWVDQRAEITALQQDVAERELRVEQLEGDLSRWEDDAYVVAQARSRLRFVLPGETSYVVPRQSADEAAAIRSPADTAAQRLLDAGSGQPWFTDLLDSARAADRR